MNERLRGLLASARLRKLRDIGGRAEKSSVFWSWLRACVFFLAAAIFGVLGYQLRPGSEPQLAVHEPTVTVLASQQNFTASVDMTLSADSGNSQLYSLALTITPANPIRRQVRLGVWFGDFPQPVPETKVSILSSQDHQYEYYQIAALNPGSSRTVQQTFTFASAQPIGEAANGGRLRVTFPDLTGETPGPQYSYPACGPGLSILRSYATICASLGSGSWYVPILQADKSEFSSNNPSLAGYQFLAGDVPTLLAGNGWTWVGINGVTMLAADVTAEDNQQSNLFYSGIFLGVAVGAAIAFLTELFRPAWRKEPAGHKEEAVLRSLPVLPISRAADFARNA